MKNIFIRRPKRISNAVTPQNRIFDIKNKTEKSLIPFFANDMPTTRIKKRNQNR